MASATTYCLQRRYNGQSLLLAFTDNPTSADILQIVAPGGEVIVSVSYNGTVNFNASGLTSTTGAGGAGLYTLNRQLDRQYRINPTSVSLPITTVAQAFAAAFPLNPQNLDIIQVINAGGNISYWLDSTGVAHGS